MLNAFSNFAADETGAVTVDWVVLTAALVGLGLAVMSVVRGGVSDLTTDIQRNLCGVTISNTMADNVVSPADCPTPPAN